MIVSAYKEDWPVLIEIWESAVIATHDFLAEADFLYYKSQLPIYFNHVTLYLFKIDNEIKGFIGISEDSIEMLFIHNNFRGRGVGKQLLEYVINNFNINKVEVNKQNTQALEFYKYLGFKEVRYSDVDSEGKNYPIISLELA